MPFSSRHIPLFSFFIAACGTLPCPPFNYEVTAVGVSRAVVADLS